MIIFWVTNAFCYNSNTICVIIKNLLLFILASSVSSQSNSCLKYSTVIIRYICICLLTMAIILFILCIKIWTVFLEDLFYLFIALLWLNLYIKLILWFNNLKFNIAHQRTNQLKRKIVALKRFFVTCNFQRTKFIYVFHTQA